MTNGNSKRIWRRPGLRWILLVVALLLMTGAASLYAVRRYQHFYHHVTREELSHEVKHSTFQVTIRNGPPLDLQLYQQENASQQKMVLFTSGDGGWSPFCADVAAHIAANGFTVVGLDVKQYLVTFATPQKPVSPEDLTRDYDSIARLAIVQTGVERKDPIILAGWSLGAGYSVIVASQPQFDIPVSEVVAVSLPEYGELAWKRTDALIYLTHGRPREKAFDALQYLKELKQTPIAFVNATSDDNAPFREAQWLFQATPGNKSFYAVKASGHHFEGGEKEFYQDLDVVLSIPQIAARDDKRLKEANLASR